MIILSRLFDKLSNWKYGCFISSIHILNYIPFVIRDFRPWIKCLLCRLCRGGRGLTCSNVSKGGLSLVRGLW